MPDDLHRTHHTGLIGNRDAPICLDDDNGQVAIREDLRLDDRTQQRQENGKNYLKANYLSAVQKLDKGFVKNNASANFTLLFKAFNAASDAEKIKIALEYYDFIVRKAYKNMGFSLKVLREYMLTKSDFAVYGDDKYSTVRNKLYQIFDFWPGHVVGMLVHPPHRHSAETVHDEESNQDKQGAC